MAAVDRTARFAPSVDADRQPAGDPAAQSARLRLLQPVEKNCRPGSCPNPVDAARRGIANGDIVRLFNDRGACLAAAAVTDDVMPGVLQLSTGAWYDPEPGAAEQPLCVHGNPNVLTRDVGTSRLAQGCCGQMTVVECEKYLGSLPVLRAFEPPDQD